MTLIKKTTASVALVALTSGLFVSGTSAYSTNELTAANFLAKKGYVVDQSANPANYQLDRQVLRQEIAAVARARANVEKTTTCMNVFRDVSATTPNTWACYTVEALANAGLIAKNTNFRPEANITKAEAVGMIVKAAYGSEYAPEAGKGDWQKQVVDFAVAKGVVSNFTNYTTPATRGFVFELTANTLKENKDTSLEDLLNQLMGKKDESKKEETKKPENNIVRNDSTLAVTLSPENPANGMVVANSNRAVLLAFDVTAGKEDVTLRKASFKFTGLGDSKIVEDLAIYSNDVKLTKGEPKFNSKQVADVSFDRNIVVKAGETKTLYVTATIKPENASGNIANVYNQTVRVSLTNLDSSATVTGASLNGATLTPYAVANRGAVEVDTTSANGKMGIGEETNLYNFSVRESNKKEDVVVKSVTFAEGTTNGVDLDNLANLSLMANGKKLDAKFTIQKSKIVASLNQVVKSGEKVNFVLRGEATDDLNKRLELKLDDVYAVGATTDIAVATTPAKAYVTTSKNVEGTAVNFTLDRNDVNEISANTDDAKLGDLVFVTTSNYNTDIEVTVSSTDVEELELAWDLGKADAAKKVFTFKDVQLNKGTTKLPLTADVKENATNNNRIQVKVKVVALEDETLGEKVANVNKVLNNVELTKYVTVKTSGITLTAEKANVTKVVPKNNQEVVLYKGKLDLTGGENITLENLRFDSQNAGQDLNDYISGATLSVGGKKFSADVNSNNINVSSIYAEIQKNAKGVEVLLTATLKDKELTSNVNLKVAPAEISASSDNAKGNRATIATTGYYGNKVSTEVNLTSKTTLKVEAVKNVVKDNVLAGNKNVTLAAFKLKDTTTDVYFNSLTFTSNQANLASSISNVKLMDGSTVISNSATLEGATVKFENFTLPQSSKDRNLTVVADVSAVSTAGGQTSTILGDVTFTGIVADTTDATSDASLATVASETVKIVPVVVTYQVTEKYGNGQTEAIVKINVDKGDNEISKISLKSLNLTNGAALALLKVNGNDIASKDVTAINEDVTNLKSFDVRMVLDGAADTSTIILNKVVTHVEFADNTVTAQDVDSVNKDSASLGIYTKK